MDSEHLRASWWCCTTPPSAWIQRIHQTGFRGFTSLECGVKLGSVSSLYSKVAFFHYLFGIALQAKNLLLHLSFIWSIGERASSLLSGLTWSCALFLAYGSLIKTLIGGAFFQVFSSSIVTTTQHFFLPRLMARYGLLVLRFPATYYFLLSFS